MVWPIINFGTTIEYPATLSIVLLGLVLRLELGTVGVVFYNYSKILHFLHLTILHINILKYELRYISVHIVSVESADNY
jgi:hypothetical protein